LATNALTRKTTFRLNTGILPAHIRDDAAVNNAGAVVLVGDNYADNGVTANSVLFVNTAGSTKVLATSNFGYYGLLSINATGAVVVSIVLPNGSGGGMCCGAALNGDTVNGRVIWPGQMIDGCKVMTAVTGPQSINAAGQIAVNVLCSKNHNLYNEIVLATPTTN